MRAEQTFLAFNSLFGAATQPFGCGEVNVFYTLVEVAFVRMRDWLLLVDCLEDITMLRSRATMRNLLRNRFLITRGSYVRLDITFEVLTKESDWYRGADCCLAVWRGPEMPPNEFVDQMKGTHWHAAGIGFGVRGSQIHDVIGLFEGKFISSLHCIWGTDTRQRLSISSAKKRLMRSTSSITILWHFFGLSSATSRCRVIVKTSLEKTW